ncbi:MAG: Flp family type IVb pilin [Clostridia bacterium]|jgi:pilus assembly protein Flp/PilA|nr:Flp family type IVb pilin [Oscillospiraceae bacterium]MBR3430729.1 Flp family type IVb pilin [Clostridia bacterium]
MLKNFVKDESGQGLAEYALILALIAIVVIAALTLIGNAAKSKLNTIGTTINGTT